MLIESLGGGGPARTILALGMLAATSGCGIAPGDYLIYRVAFADVALTPDCFGGTVPADEAEDSSTLRDSGTFVLYVGANDKFYLDTGSETLEGAESGDGYGFAGQFKDVTINGVAPDDVTITIAGARSVDFTLDGELIDGTMVNSDSSNCKGPMGQCPDPPANSCTQTRSFVGTEVNDVRIEHQL